MILVIIGPSGTGKSSLVKALTAEGIVTPHTTWTDRSPRPEEANSIEHTFVSKDEFNRRAQDDFFLGTAEVFTHRYGMPKWPTGEDVLLSVILRATIVDTFIEAAGDERVMVYQVQAPRNRIAVTLAARSLSEAEMNARLAEHDGETALGSMIADRIFMNDTTLETLVDQVREAIEQDRHLDHGDEVVDLRPQTVA